jgi:hypothetical protein
LSFRNIYLEADGTCTIGLQDVASIPLLVNYKNTKAIQFINKYGLDL